jgi:cyclopropane-fatty-acyl-phospholipid synthase
MLRLLLSRIVRQGTLTVIHSNGKEDVIGVGDPHVAMRLADKWAGWELLLNPDLKLGEHYMDGRLIIEKGDVADLLDLLMSNLAQVQPSGLHKLARSLRRLQRRAMQFNPSRNARKHAKHHYDLPGELFDLFLDRDRQYSCAYFLSPRESLEEAQQNKKRHIIAKLNLDKHALKVLDIGCGWGGLALDLARDHGAEVLGVTLSDEQINVARTRAEENGLEGRCRFELTDYRAIRGRYDRIVSVGMFEHVGIAYYAAYFAKVRQLLSDDGAMLLHTIGRSDGPGSTNPWIAKYIFPGGYAPALSEILQAIEASGLIVTDIEVLRLHYADTCRLWRNRFVANRAAARGIFDERFYRMWEFYLAGAEMAFRHDGQVVFQIQLAKRQGALPLTRDYMLDVERTLRANPPTAATRPLRLA